MAGQYCRTSMSRHYPSVLATVLLPWRDHSRGHASKREFLIEGLFTVSEGLPVKVTVGSMVAGRKARHYRQGGGWYGLSVTHLLH